MALGRARWTWPRRPTVHPDEVVPSSAVAAPTKPDAVGELHSMTRAGAAWVAIASARLVAPAWGRHPTTGRTLSPGRHKRPSATAGAVGLDTSPRSMGRGARNCPSWT